MRVSLGRKLATDAPTGEPDVQQQSDMDILEELLLLPDAAEPDLKVALEGEIVDKTVGPVFAPSSAPAPAPMPAAKRSVPSVPAAKPKTMGGNGDMVMVALDAIVTFVVWAWQLVAPMKRPVAPKYRRNVAFAKTIKRSLAATLVLAVVAALGVFAYQLTSSSPGKGSGPAIVPPAAQPKTGAVTHKLPAILPGAVQPKTEQKTAPVTHKLPAILPGALVGAAVVVAHAPAAATGSNTVTGPATVPQGKTAPATATGTTVAQPPAGTTTGTTAAAPAGGTPATGGTATNPSSTPPTETSTAPSSSTSTGTGPGTTGSGANDPQQGPDGTCPAGYYPSGASSCVPNGTGGGE